MMTLLRTAQQQGLDAVAALADLARLRVPGVVEGLTLRPAGHARLVAGCADAYVGMILDTLEAPGAPWRDHAVMGLASRFTRRGKPRLRELGQVGPAASAVAGSAGGEIAM
jgi:hypothetical protein